MEHLIAAGGRLVSIHQMEEVKCIVRIIPIWAAGIVCLVAVVQQGTFTMSQALKMDRHLGPNFYIPAVSHGGADGVAPITVMWLAPQLILMGFAEGFNIIGQIEFFNKEFPDNMTSTVWPIHCTP
nr:Protein NRT1/ PTR family 2.13 [Ipomoea trifida]